MFQIRDVYPGSRNPVPTFFQPVSRIPNPGSEFFHPGSRIRIKEYKYFNPKVRFLSSRKYDPDCSSRIRVPDPDPDFLPIQDLESRIRIRNTDYKIVIDS
jgi:hypothetical protein